MNGFVAQPEGSWHRLGRSPVAAPKPPPPPIQQPPRPTSSAACFCRVCDRSYTSTSALEQHYRDTPVHPKCMRCNVGFVDDAAIRAVSPLLNLDQHYKTSPMHALCTVCDVGFEDKEALDQHTDASHPGFRCRTCNIPFGSAALLDAHYQESPRHPRCPECKLSFEDNLGLIQVLLFVSSVPSPSTQPRSM
ncbi:hypothetical protein BJV77DRAFT_952820 [Russula vinacea]|nr:hypothetical protein BJV77DRAFT_952820 [Russula vinacea]